MGRPTIQASLVSQLDLTPAAVGESLSTCSAPSLLALLPNSSAIQCYVVLAPAAGQTLVATKYVGIASTPSTSLDRVYSTARNVSRAAATTGYAALLASHRAAWTQLWADGGDIIIPDHAELQLATRASIFHLVTNVRAGDEGLGVGDNSIAPAGLTSDSYAGQVFWDADIWMGPSLLALLPSHAESINNFRFRQLAAAQHNAQLFNRSGALYPWTAGWSGNCTAVGPW